MHEENLNDKKFVGYDYKEISVNRDKAALYLDCYESFGWNQDEHFKIESTTGKVVLKLKRDRKIANKVELTRLERNFEACVEEVHAYEKQKVSTPKMLAISIGILGTVFMAGSVFAITADPPIIWLCVLLAIPGFLGWILPKPIYHKLIEKETGKFAPLISQKLDEIYEVCEKGHALL